MRDLDRLLEIDEDVAAMIVGTDQRETVVRWLAEMVRQSLRADGGSDDGRG
jgi:hypothetical protein